MRNHSPHIGQILEGIHFGANTCRACIRTRANTGNYSWRIIYVLVSCQGVALDKFPKKPADKIGKGKLSGPVAANIAVPSL